MARSPAQKPLTGTFAPLTGTFALCPSQIHRRGIAPPPIPHLIVRGKERMDTRVLIALIVIIAAALIAVVIIVSRGKRSEHLRNQFGPEYDRTMQQHGDARHAETVLIAREKRVEKFSLRPLPPADRERYAADWAAVQNRFIDDPSIAVMQADKLVTTVMTAR